MTARLSLAVALLAALLASDSVQAQTRSSQSTTTSTSRGLFGTTSVGGSSSTRTPSGSTGGTPPSQNGSQGQSASQAQSAFDMQNAAAGGIGAPQIQTTQQAGAFVGADSSNTANFRSLQTGPIRTTAPNFAQLGNLFAQGMQQVNQANNQGGRQQTPVRVSLRLGFAPQPVSSTTIAAFETRLTNLPGIRFVGSAQVTMEGRTAILRGTVASEDDRQLAEALAMMEPAVQNVKNELVVDSSATTAEPLPLAPATSSP